MVSKLISLDSIVSQKEDVDVTELNGEKVMMDLDKGMYFMLNKTGSYIWDSINEPKRVSEIIDKLTEKYDIDKKTCESKVLKYLEKLRDEEIIFVD
ncbi:TPA: lasso peptide biosynthesis PqqD family chaperone [Clostridium perfringens]|uniref:lasso peptide biosynthesis PqqD family chaperone n=1 Tax=Clostridium perfringens TaxID=1502 RepID=UPI001CB0987C|nr:lasso peptide biosynthesis PqqD family chaperone [Clostridium perfringens]MDM0445810.1 lasso peptide biosynthesis PqqD family chaperone [Clostridium perfringens]MDM0451601.1 lasso peptide biosynthesis PqqD family chaperone [Clostridium perfringens]HBI6897037.1 lasso peptide biosynthesis PqqD family chaperone [Clostridium perfringens]HBI6917928.1 lasso peptide biosynthesis PqqD family chaperone [Clostridium perfringens]HBI7037768.1 lasso peptide biosynthesis PqqD family chaperone [Clostridiu